MAAFATFPTLIPTFRAEWGINNTQAGWISGIYFGGYVLAVAILTALTDRMSAKRVYLVCMALSAVSALGFALWADGLWSASLWRLAQGIALAGTYMPGLKALTDQLPVRLYSRGIAFYTASFGVGASASYYFSGVFEAALDWRWAFSLCALGPLVALLLAMLVFESRTPKPQHRPRTHLLDFRPVFANRPALGFTIAYCVHNAELFAFRSWLVAFLVFSQMHQAPGALGVAWSAATLAALVNLIGVPASIFGNELASRIGRQWAVIYIMSLSALLGMVFGFTAPLPFWLVVGAAFLYGVTITGESATVTAGLIKVAEPNYKGTTMAMHSVVGFVGAFLGPIVFGIVLDMAGGETQTHAWGIAFACVAVVMLIGPVAMIKLVGLKKILY